MRRFLAGLAVGALAVGLPLGWMLSQTTKWFELTIRLFMASVEANRARDGAAT